MTEVLMRMLVNRGSLSINDARKLLGLRLNEGSGILTKEDLETATRQIREKDKPTK
jgi:hypothetical protein